MNGMIENQLKMDVDYYFSSVRPEDEEMVEAMYQAFKKRMILELRIAGGSNEGVVWGNLEDKAR
jgi:hypothetical protein